MNKIGQSGRNLDFSCQGKCAVVTAGGSGLGRVIAEALLDNGAEVLVCDISDAVLEECQRLLPRVRLTNADVSDPSQVQRLFDEVERCFSGIDILINNAGIGGPVATVEQLKSEDVERIMEVNVGGMFNCARHAVRLLKSRGGGSIVNISSVAGRVGYPERSAYSASKWAVIGFTRSLSAELGPHNIRVNAILPGVIEGERHDRLYREKAKHLGISFEEAESRYFDQVALRRNITPRDVAAAVVFLCAPASSNISGQSLGVCGDIQYMRQ